MPDTRKNENTMSRIYAETEIETEAGTVIVDAWVEFGIQGHYYDGKHGAPEPDDAPEIEIISTWYAADGGEADLTDKQLELAREQLLEVAKSKLNGNE